tara:strand:- start:27 stop:443 length:417 start_codon:yes stop_codon:yes gene_type:complete
MNTKFTGSKINQYKNNDLPTVSNDAAAAPLSSGNQQISKPVKSSKQNPTEKPISTQILDIRNNLSTTRIFLVILIILYLGIVGYLIFYVNSNSNKFNKIQDEFQKAFDELNQMLNVLQMREAQITAAINNYMTTSSPS